MANKNGDTRPNMKLSSLPLRQTTLSTLVRRGFITTSDIENSKSSGGVSNLAAELGVSLVEAASMSREVLDAVAMYQPRDSGEDSLNAISPNRLSSSLARTAEVEDHHQQQQQQKRPRIDQHVDHNPPSSISDSAASILQRCTAPNENGSTARHIVTFCRAIDSLLGGGLARSELTEVAGPPGIGKTQLAMQICVDARLPRAFGGVEGEAVYIDSEGSFSPERCYDMAAALVKHVQGSAERRKLAATSNQHNTGTKRHRPPADVPPWFTAQNILDGIHVFRVYDEAAQTATIHSLPMFLKRIAQDENRAVRLVVVDSIAFHYRCAPPGSDFMARTRSITTMAAFLADLAANFDLAVVAINHMTTKVGGTSDDATSKLVPALGESWAHATTTRLLLSSTNKVHSATPAARCCRLVKSPYRAAGSALYSVTEFGIRDAVSPNDTALQRHG